MLLKMLKFNCVCKMEQRGQVPFGISNLLWLFTSSSLSRLQSWGKKWALITVWDLVWCASFIIILYPFFYFLSNVSLHSVCVSALGCSGSQSKHGPWSRGVSGLMGKVDINTVIILVVTYLQSDARAVKKRKRKTCLQLIKERTPDWWGCSASLNMMSEQRTEPWCGRNPTERRRRMGRVAQCRLGAVGQG